MNKFYTLSFFIIFLFSQCGKKANNAHSQKELDSLDALIEENYSDTLEEVEEVKSIENKKAEIKEVEIPIDTNNLYNHIKKYFNSGTTESFGNALLENAKEGFYFIHRPGTTNLIDWVNSDNLAEFERHWKTLGKHFSKEKMSDLARKLPKFNCDKGFSKSGIFYDLISDPQMLSKAYKQAIKLAIPYTQKDIASCQKKEKEIAIALSLTQHEVLFYLGQDSNQEWYLVALDINKYDCSL